MTSIPHSAARSSGDFSERHEYSPLVTIGIPTYNRAGTYLPEALGSALAQDYPNLEIIVSDNASTDGTESFVKGLNDPRIRYFRHEPSIRPNDNFNFCVREASGTYFLLLHDDDLVDPDFISTCIEAAQGRADLGVIRTGIRLIDREGQVLGENLNSVEGLSVSDWLRAWFRSETAFYLPNTLYNTQALRELGGFQSKKEMFQDVVVLARLAARHGRADVREVKASFRSHEANMGKDASRAMDWAEDCLYLRDVLVDVVPTEAKARIHVEASAYLCAKAYQRARAIGQPLARLRTYARIFAMFGYRYLPLPSLPSLARALKRRFMRGAGSLLGRAYTISTKGSDSK